MMLVGDLLLIGLIYAPALLNYIAVCFLTEKFFKNSIGVASNGGMVELTQFPYQKGFQDDMSSRSPNIMF